MSLNSVFFSVGLAAEAAVMGLLLYRRIWRKLPVFSLYCAWILLSDVAYRAIAYSKPEFTLRFYLAATVVECTLQLVVLMELARSLFRELDANRSRGLLAAIGASILVAGAAIWPIASAPEFIGSTQIVQIAVQLKQAVAMLDVLLLIFLVGIARLLDLHWANRALQVAEGFGFYVAVSAAVAVASSRLSPARFKNLDFLLAGSFLVCMSFWVFSFAHRDAMDGEADA